MVNRAIRAARDWAAEHRHQQPDDRMLRICIATAFHELADEFDHRALPLAAWRVAAAIRDRADEIEPTARED